MNINTRKENAVDGNRIQRHKMHITSLSEAAICLVRCSFPVSTSFNHYKKIHDHSKELFGSVCCHDFIATVIQLITQFYQNERFFFVQLTEKYFVSHIHLFCLFHQRLFFIKSRRFNFTLIFCYSELSIILACMWLSIFNLIGQIKTSIFTLNK